jgi:hypothetical protein
MVLAPTPSLTRAVQSSEAAPTPPLLELPHLAQKVGQVTTLMAMLLLAMLLTLVVTLMAMLLPT